MSIVHLLEHNIGTYKQVKCTLLKKHQVALVQATGTGKSFIMLKLLEDLFGGMRVLYVVPYHRIGENFESYVEFKELKPTLESFTVKTYDSFSSSKTPAVEDYDVVMIDEFHHLGSALNGRKICEFKDEMVRVGKYVIAVTATPIRALDNYRDMGDEAFADCVVNGISVGNAIEQGILPKLNYALAFHDGVNIGLDSDGRVNFPSCEQEVKRVIAKYCHTGQPRKWLAYGATLNSLTEIKSTLKGIFDGVEIFVVHGKKSVSANERVIQKFIDCNQEAVLCSVNMLLEGTHLPVVLAGILNFRHIISLNVFWQMIGRLYSVGSKSEPLFINIAGSKFYRPTTVKFDNRRIEPAIFDRSMPCLHDVTTIQTLDWVKWATAVESKYHIEYNGKHYASLSEFYRENNDKLRVSFAGFAKRVSEGWDYMEALTTPSYKNRCYSYHGEIFDSIGELSRKLKINAALMSGWLQEVCEAAGYGSTPVVVDDVVDAKLRSREKRVMIRANNKDMCIWNGVQYDSPRELANALGLDKSHVNRMLKKANGVYTKFCTSIERSLKRKEQAPVLFNGVVYEDLHKLAEDSGIYYQKCLNLCLTARRTGKSYDELLASYRRNRANAVLVEGFTFRGKTYDKWVDWCEEYDIPSGVLSWTLTKWRKTQDVPLSELLEQLVRYRNIEYHGEVYSSTRTLNLATGVKQATIRELIDTTSSHEEFECKLDALVATKELK